MENRINLRWRSHKNTMFSMFDTLFATESMVDVTIAVEGRFVRAHKLVLSACSPYFQEIFGVAGSEPILYMRGVKHAELEALLHYMYHGEVSVSQDQLPSILEIAKDLKICGLSDICPASPSESSNVIDEEDGTLDTATSCNPVLSEPPKLKVIPSPPPLIRASTNKTPPVSPYKNEEYSNVIPPRKKLRMDPQRSKTQFSAYEPDLSGLVSGNRSEDSEHSNSSKAPHASDHLSRSRMLSRSLRQENEIDNGEESELEHEQIREFFHESEEDDMGRMPKLEGQEGYMQEVVEIDDEEDSLNHPDNWGQAGLLPNSLSFMNSSLPSEEVGTSASRTTSVRTDVPNLPKCFDDSIQSRQKRSGVWQHFSTIASEEGDSELYSQCNYCYKKYKRSTSTTNMKCHLNVSHQIFY